MNRSDFEPLIITALQSFPGHTAKVHQVCEYIWIHNNARLLESGKTLYTWQYDTRWAANNLRRNNRLISSPRGSWTLILKK